MPESSSTFQFADLGQFLRSGWIAGLAREELAIGWGEWQQAEPSDHGCLFMPDFYLRSSAWQKTQHFALIERAELLDLLKRHEAEAASRASSDDRACSLVWSEPEYREFEAKFTEIRKAMRERGLKKAVPVVFAEAHLPDATGFSIDHLRAVLVRMMQLPHTLFPYGFWRKTQSHSALSPAAATAAATKTSTTEATAAATKASTIEGMLGATPEILFRIIAATDGMAASSGCRIETAAIAGTRAKVAVNAELSQNKQISDDLMNDPKERAEHQFVIDDIARVLSQFGPVVTSKTEIVELPTLFHLRTAIEVQCDKSISFDTAARALHPTPALGVAPRTMGFGEMLRWDSAERRARFGAPFGCRIDDSTQICFVAIRNIQWQGQRAWLGSGCGIVDDSVIESEWRELQHKRDSVRRILGL